VVFPQRRAFPPFECADNSLSSGGKAIAGDGTGALRRGAAADGAATSVIGVTRHFKRTKLFNSQKQGKKKKPRIAKGQAVQIQKGGAGQPLPPTRGYSPSAVTG